MSRLAELQQRFQQCLLDPSDDPHQPWVGSGGRALPGRQLSAYVHAYAARLKEVLAGDYPAVRMALGADRFDALAEGYLRRHPSRHFSLREFGRDLPAFVASLPDYRSMGWLAELARFEWTLGLAFDAADAPVACAGDMAAIAPAQWPALRFTPHPSVRRLTLAWNTIALWHALSADPPEPIEATAEAAVPWLIWRHGLSTRFRSLEPDEALALDTLLGGACFDALCDALCRVLPADSVPLRAASLLKGWLEQGLISTIDGAG